MGFKFELGSKAKISVSGEAGEIIGRAQYLEGGDMYRLRYQAADGRANEVWWSEGAIEAVSDED